MDRRIIKTPLEAMDVLSKRMAKPNIWNKSFYTDTRPTKENPTNVRTISSMLQELKNAQKSQTRDASTQTDNNHLTNDATAKTDDNPQTSDASTQTFERLDDAYLAGQKVKDAEFFSKIPGEPHDDVAIVMVSHLFPGDDVYLDELKKRGLAIIILKDSSNNEATHEEFGGKYNFQLSKNDAKYVQKVVETFNEHISEEKQIVIIDHGGYFARNIVELQVALNKRIIGIVENTQNGHDKYLKEQQKQVGDHSERIPVPIVSIADCELKNLVEPAIGLSVVGATESVLRDNGITMHDKKSLILGYGKVGEAIADNLPAGATQVYDVSPMAKIKAIQKRHNLITTDERVAALGRADVIFCAGGKNAFRESDYQHLKDGAFISTVTSRDDSLHMPSAPYKLERELGDHSPIYKYVNQETGHTVNLLNDGNAANFIAQKPAVGSSIRAIQGIEMAAFEHVASERKKLQNGLQLPPKEKQDQVAKLWIDMLG